MYIFVLVFIILLYYYKSLSLYLLKEYTVKYLKNFNFYNRNNVGVIIGFSVSDKYDYHKLFILSLCRVSRNTTHLILFTNIIYNNSGDIYYKICKNRKINFIKIINYYPYYPYNNKLYPINKKYLLKNIPNISKNYYFWNTMRFYIVKVWLEKYGNSQSEYLLCDVRDILFQCDPFQWNYKTGLYIGEECEDEIKKSGGNFKWVSVYSNSSSLLNKRILNSGVIYGDYISIKIFIHQLLQFMLNNHPGNVDQGAVIYIIYTYKKWKFPITIFSSGFGPFRSIGRIINKVKVINLTLFNNDYTIPCVVHQFDRGINNNSIFQKMIKRIEEKDYDILI